MYSLVRQALFRCDPEWSHDITLNWLKMSQRSWLKCTYNQAKVQKPVTCMGLTFDNPLGLAAGLDKNGECIDAFAAMGFGFVEIGTVTPRPQPGNPKPRMFRIPEKEALINRMGFNNHGVDYLIEQVKRANYDGILGINIGKNKDTEEHCALDDYLVCLRKVYPFASYVTVNISSPNTPGLRNLQYGEVLDGLLNGLKQEQAKLSDTYGRYVPIAIKIAPDLKNDEVQSIARSLVNAGIDGVIATNTTIDRTSVKGLPYADEAGGLSGAVLTTQSQSIVKALNRHLDGALPIIGVGGISSAEDAQARISAGASLVQIYSALIYQGPALVNRIAKAL